DALQNLPVAAAGPGRIDRALEVVHDRKEIAQQAFLLNADGFLALLPDALAGVFAIGQRAEIFVLEFRDFLVLFGDASLELAVSSAIVRRGGRFGSTMVGMLIVGKGFPVAFVMLVHPAKPH